MLKHPADARPRRETTARPQKPKHKPIERENFNQAYRWRAQRSQNSDIFGFVHHKNGEAPRDV